jgi:hypothetical protein
MVGSVPCLIATDCKHRWYITFLDLRVSLKFDLHILLYLTLKSMGSCWTIFWFSVYCTISWPTASHQGQTCFWSPKYQAFLKMALFSVDYVFTSFCVVVLFMFYHLTFLAAVGTVSWCIMTSAVTVRVRALVCFANLLQLLFHSCRMGTLTCVEPKFHCVAKDWACNLPLYMFLWQLLIPI